ncbi:hypothetical protein EV121DRAFT_273994 [Schizophyllum commune]
MSAKVTGAMGDFAARVKDILDSGPTPSALKDLASVLGMPDVPVSLRYHHIAACCAWFAADRSVSPGQIVSGDAMHPFARIFLRSDRSEAAERKEILSSLTRLLFDVAALRDQISGSVTLCVVSKSWTKVNLQLTPENLSASFYLTPQHLHEATPLATQELRNILQIYVEMFGLRASGRYRRVYDSRLTSTSEPTMRTEPATDVLDQSAEHPRLFHASATGTRWGPPAMLAPDLAPGGRTRMQRYREEIAELQTALAEKDETLVEMEELMREMEAERNAAKAECARLRQELDTVLAPAPSYEQTMGTRHSCQPECAMPVVERYYRPIARRSLQGASVSGTLTGQVAAVPSRIPSEAVSQYMRSHGMEAFYAEVASIYAYTKRDPALARIATLNIDDELLNGLLALVADDL